MTNHDKLASIIEEFQQWRNSRAHRNAKTPENLRRKAVALLNQHSSSQITTALKLSGANLKTWSQQLNNEIIQTDFIALPDLRPLEKPTENHLNLKIAFNNGNHMQISGDLSSTAFCTLMRELNA